jgi:hypothetical protein
MDCLASFSCLESSFTCVYICMIVNEAKSMNN